jgi:hypothetical protein
MCSHTVWSNRQHDNMASKSAVQHHCVPVLSTVKRTLNVQDSTVSNAHATHRLCML